MLSAQKVFIDTQYFKGNRFNFSTSELEAFIKLCQKNELEHVVTSTADGEIRAQLTAVAAQHVEKMEELVSEATMKNIPSVLHAMDVELSNLDRAAYVNSVTDAYDCFLYDASTRVITPDAVNAEALLDAYFDFASPHGLGKKKSIMSLLADLDKDETLHYISGVTDYNEIYKNYPQFMLHESIGDFLDYYNKKTNPHYEKLEEALVNDFKWIRREVEIYFAGLEVDNCSSWADSRVVQFNALPIWGIKPLVLNIDDGRAQVTCSIEVILSVEVEGPNFVDGWYDEEDEVMRTYETIVRSDVSQQAYLANIDVKFDEEDGKFIIADILFDFPELNGKLEVNVEELEFEVVT